MLKTMARATFLLMLAVLVVAWAVSLGKTDASEPQDEQPVGEWKIYS
jgi:hypothetical protein